MNPIDAPGEAADCFRSSETEIPWTELPTPPAKGGTSIHGGPMGEDLLTILLPKVIEATGCGDWHPVRRVLERRDCRILFLTSGRGRRNALALKVFRPGMVSKNLAMNLHRRSLKLHEAATNECAVPEPVAYFPEANAWVMRYVDAPLAGSVLMRKCYSSVTRTAIIKRAASWLNWFHGRFGEVPMPFDASPYQDGLAKSCSWLHSPDGCGRDRFLVDCMVEAKRIAKGLNSRVMSHSTAHGDFTPFNLFIDGAKAVGFDYRANHRMPVYHDMSRFLIYLDVYRPTIAREDELSRWGCRGMDFECFFESYGGDPSVVKNGTWLELHFLEVVRRLVSISDPKQGLGSRMLRQWESTALRRGARAMLKGLG